MCIDGKNNDDKDQHDQQHSDNGRVNSILEFRIPGVEVLKHFTIEVAKSRSGVEASKNFTTEVEKCKMEK